MPVGRGRAHGRGVRVIDHGRGIPADQLDRVFDKFHRVEDPLRMTTSGTGLGLFIARRLAGAMGGTLTVESTLGKGATFCFELPLAPEGATLPAAVTCRVRRVPSDSPLPAPVPPASWRHRRPAPLRSAGRHARGVESLDVMLSALEDASMEHCG